MNRGDDMHSEKSFDRDDEGEELGGFTGGIPYDDDEDEDGGWAINKDHSDSLWDSAEESDDDDEEIEADPADEPADHEGGFRRFSDRGRRRDGAVQVHQFLARSTRR